MSPYIIMAQMLIFDILKVVKVFLTLTLPSKEQYRLAWNMYRKSINDHEGDLFEGSVAVGLTLAATAYTALFYIGLYGLMFGGVAFIEFVKYMFAAFLLSVFSGLCVVVTLVIFGFLLGCADIIIPEIRPIEYIKSRWNTAKERAKV